MYTLIHGGSMILGDVERDGIRRLLQHSVIAVTFQKTDGTERVMNCTLNPELIPATVNENTSTRKVNPDVCPVWDTDIQAWRSFRWDSLKNIAI
jgi:hypothetical protein